MSIENNNKKDKQEDTESIEKRKEAIILELSRNSPKENGSEYVFFSLLFNYDIYIYISFYL